jgi:hypothetical protein
MFVLQVRLRKVNVWLKRRFVHRSPEVFLNLSTHLLDLLLRVGQPVLQKLAMFLDNEFDVLLRLVQ